MHRHRTPRYAAMFALSMLMPISAGCFWDPTGDVLAGTGPVASAADARLRVLSEYMGVQGLDLTTTQGKVTGTLGMSFFDVYEIPNGPRPTGTQIGSHYVSEPRTTLNAAYYIFWVDPLPLADLGHRSHIVLVRASDGRITAQDADFPPVVDGVNHLYFDDDRTANRIYRHRAWDDANSGPMRTQIKELRTQIKESRTLRANGLETAFGGLAVAGSTEARRANDMALAQELFGAMTGNPIASTIDMLVDKKDDRINKQELIDALKKASEGLGDCDKFLFVLASHASEDGEVDIGTDELSWEELCKILADNVSAQFINIVLSTCYSGVGLTEFIKWDEKTTSSVRILTTTDSTKPSYAHPENGAFALLCIVDELKAVLEDAGLDQDDGVPTLAQIEAAFTELDITKADIDKKVCDYIDELVVQHPEDADELRKHKKEEYTDEGGNGEPEEGGFPPDDPTPPTEDDFDAPFSPLGGFGTTNDGGGVFDLSGGSLSSNDGGQTVDLSGTMQITNQTGHDAGTFQLSGQRIATDGLTWRYSATGTMRVFTGADLETLNGNFNLTFHRATIAVSFDGTHTQNQQVVFNLTGPR